MVYISVGALASIAHPRRGLTMVQYSGINAVLDSSQKDLRTMKSNRLAVSAASLQWADEVKVVSSGIGIMPGRQNLAGAHMKDFHACLGTPWCFWLIPLSCII